MPDPVEVSRATLVEIRLPDGEKPSATADGAVEVPVQFNPASLKVTYANTFANEDQSGGAAIQYVSKSSTKLAVDLWFDATVDPDLDDVRDRTRQVHAFFVPKATGDEGRLAPPAVRFAWGSFLFEGVMTSMDETLDFFSPDGRPLRARVAIAITSQFLQFLSRSSPGGSGVGARPLTSVPSGAGIQQLLGRKGSARGWQEVARANGIENPRMLPAGAVVDLGRPAGGR